MSHLSTVETILRAAAARLTMLQMISAFQIAFDTALDAWLLPLRRNAR
jgi:hypothetical protein